MEIKDVQKNNSLDLYNFILSNFEKAKKIDAEASERSKKANNRSIENRQELSKRQEEFRRKWQ